MSERATHQILDTPTGLFAVMKDRDGCLHLEWVDGTDDESLANSTASDDVAPELLTRLRRYFDGDETVTFDDVPTPEGSAFFHACWDACRTIPRGETRSYAQLAEMASGSTGAARAAGQAMRRNPMPIVIPCHRVVGANGALHGFAGSQDSAGPEVARKQQLLALESAAIANTLW